jgi:hypothetical protein
MTLSLIRQGWASHQLGYFYAKSMLIGSDQYGSDKIEALCNTSDSLVAWWSGLLTTRHEVPGSIPGPAVGIFPNRG